MKVLRKLAKHGNAHHVAIPPQAIDFLRWRSGDQLVVEVRDRRELIVHLPFTADDLRAPGPSSTIDASLPDEA